MFYLIEENDFIFSAERCFEFSPHPACMGGCNFVESIEQCGDRDGALAEPRDVDTWEMVNMDMRCIVFILFLCLVGGGLISPQ